MSLSIRRRAALWGDRVAVVDHATGETVSYGDLAARVDRAAGRLAALGVGPGDAVSLVSRNRPVSLVLPFAARRLGAVYAPLSHRLPPSAVAGPHDAVSPAVVVHEQAQRDLVRGLDPDETLTLPAFRDVEPADHRPAGDGSDAPLLALHAPPRGSVPDGGTGTGADADANADVGPEDADAGPEDDGGDADADDGRGTDVETAGTEIPVVAYPARAVEWNCITEAAAWGLGRSDCAPQLLPLSHATGLLGLALPLLYVGGTVVVLRAFDPEDALAAVAARGATCALGRVPEVREASEAEDFDRVAGSSLSWVACADRVPDGVRGAFATAGVPVFRTFGTPSTGPNNLYVPPERAVDAPPDSVGRPFPDCEARVLDAAGDPVAPGDAGLLAVRGPVVAGGYFVGGRVAGDDGTWVAGRFDGEWVSTGALARRPGGDDHLGGDSDGDYHVVGWRTGGGGDAADGHGADDGADATESDGGE